MAKIVFLVEIEAPNQEAVDDMLDQFAEVVSDLSNSHETTTVIVHAAQSVDG